MTPERVAVRVAELIDSIRHSLSDAFAEHNAALTIGYIGQVHKLGIIDAAQFEALKIAVNLAAAAWEPKVDKDGLPLKD